MNLQRNAPGRPLKRLVDLFNSSDPRWKGATWAVSGGAASNTPSTSGSELLVDGAMENWASDTDLTSWTEGLAGTSTVNKEAAVLHGGSFAARFDVDGSGSLVQIFEPVLSSGVWYKATVWVKTGTNGYFVSVLGSLTYYTPAPTTSYTQFTIAGLGLSASGFYLRRSAGASASTSLYFDDASVFAFSLPSLFRSVRFSTQFGICKGSWTIPARGICSGVVMCLDNPSNPANYVLCFHDGASFYLIKCVNGTTTMLINSAATYGAGRYVEIRRAGNVFQAFYNGSQVGTDQTITDATLINNRFHGLFSTDAANTCADFSFIGA